MNPGWPGCRESAKFDDLRGDPRFALHSGSAEGDAFDGDAKLSGRATELTDPDERKAYGDAAGVAPEDMGLRAVPRRPRPGRAVHLNDEKNALVIASWRPGRGLIRTLRD